MPVARQSHAMHGGSYKSYWIVLPIYVPTIMMNIITHHNDHNDHHNDNDDDDDKELV
jgi:hypothetical protein